MIIEFIGSTGAGKTTLISEIQRRLTEEALAVTSFELIAELIGLRQVSHPTTRNVLQDIVALPFFLRSLYRHRAFVLFVLKALARHTGYTFFCVNYLRSIVRKLGTYEIAKRYKQDRIVLVDEGTVLSAHLLFVYTSTVCSQEEIDTFAHLVPLPDLVVYVKAPVDTLVQRSLQRSWIPREMRAQSQTLIKQYVRRATEMFDRLVQTKGIRERVLVVTNPNAAEDERGAVADRIVAFIQECGAGNDSLSVPPLRPSNQNPLLKKKHVT